MIRVLFWTLVAGLVTSCSMEEPDTHGILVDNDHEIKEYSRIIQI